MPSPAGPIASTALTDGAYATSVDYAEYVGTPPSNINRLLYLATIDIQRALMTRTYDVTDAAMILALKRACVEQVAWRVAGGQAEGIATVTRGSRAKIGSVDVEVGSGAIAGSAGLAPAAYAILEAAGLGDGVPVTEVWWWT